MKPVKPNKTAKVEVSTDQNKSVVAIPGSSKKKQTASKPPKHIKAAEKAHPNKPRPVGRPTLYKPEYNEMARKYCLLGATDKQLADLFEVNEDSIHEWKIVYPKFSESIKDGKEIADAKVAASLFHRATGYSHDAVKIVADVKTKKEHVVHYVENYPPETTACIFWLKNRQKEKWRDKTEVEAHITTHEATLDELA